MDELNIFDDEKVTKSIFLYSHVFLLSTYIEKLKISDTSIPDI